MSTDPGEQSEALTNLRREADYYRQRTNELTRDLVKVEFTVSELRHQVRQKRQGFSLLSDLARTVGAHAELTEIFGLVVHGVHSTLSMDRTVVLRPGGQDHTFEVTHWIGYGSEDAPGGRTLQLAAGALGESGALLVNKSVEETPAIAAIREATGIPYFICAPVVLGEHPLGLLISGRQQESKPRSPPLDQGDLDTFQSIAGFISASVQNVHMKLLEETDRLKTEFFANISHEFRTPITLSLGPAGALLSGRHGEVSAPVREQVEVIQRNQQRLLRLVNQILDLAKLEAGRMQLTAQHTPQLNGFLRERAGMFEGALSQRGIGLRFELDSRADEALDFYVDRDLLDKAFVNLLSNANKFTERGAITVRTLVAERDGYVEISVRDTGKGIEADQVPFIFDRFRQADGSESSVQAGTGIGLSMVKQVAELHGGEVGVQSVFGEGTTFTIRLPLGRGIHEEKGYTLMEAGGVELEEGGADLLRAESLHPDELQAELAHHRDVKRLNEETDRLHDPSKETVLYVDDNADLRNYVSDLLRGEYNVYVAADGADALEVAPMIEPDLILSDLMMPHVTGTELLEKIRADRRFDFVPFVLLTARSELDAKVEGLEGGADDYLSKPFSERELLVRVRNLIELRKRQLQIKKELRAAREIQRTLLPPAEQRFEQWALDALYHPCEELSGDFFESIRVGPWLYVYLADVTSHGTASAQVTYLIKGLVQQVLRDQPLPLDSFVAALQAGYQALGVGYDVGYQILRVHLEDGLLDYVRGNAPPALIGATGRRLGLLMPAPGSALTSMPAAEDMVPDVETRQLARDEELFLFTDGCYEFETTSGRQFGIKRFSRLLQKSEGTGQVWMDGVLEALREQNGSAWFDDDVTILRLRQG